MLEKLPPRERQIVDILYARGEATAAEVRDALPNPPSYSAVRAILARLESKGFATHREVEQRYVYAPAVPQAKARKSALGQLVGTFFNGSPIGAATALLGMTAKVDPKELDALQAAIERVRKEQGE
jgi:predicted transcriptional regulator